MRLFDVEDRTALAPPPSVRVNGVEISHAAIAQEIQNHPAATPGEAREAATQALVIRELLLQAARERCLTPRTVALGNGQYETEVDALVRQLLDEELNLPSPSKDECERFYKTNISRFRSPTIWEAAHILMGASPSDPIARDAARARIRTMIELLRESPQCFGQLARDHSMCPSGKQEGNLGQIGPGQTTPAFERALENMTPGTISEEAIETPYGFHVIRLDRCVPGETIPFEAVQDKIAAYMQDAVFHRAASQFIALLAGKATIEGIQIDGAMSPLVQ